ncbi:inner membrane protein YiaA [Moraxella nonliquefaciens]|jgi:inner membrane protein yiaA|uniref:YiaAB two helix domain-containing protein n=2 Tax=Moraxella nonliquefaciens TaxID=478 RepID=A0A1B8PLK2_MORNO|nr:inner membrane protein YiaA [Moraxella nonliquefaciens]MCG7411522.1 YiaA/YiaB family protein [Moraxella nonliquefaciens]OBX47666.1 hypothetical protein A9Z65_04910 [Moraxella nonliquefaciens]OBX51864.1 hypothetical protein A9Z60_06185 [Moraxella nonliquefaciens]
MQIINKPTSAYVGASWAMLGVGVLGFLVGLWNAEMMLNEKGYYFAVLALGLYAAISLQKTIRDKAENIPVSGIYYGISWLALGLAVLLMTVGLWNATLLLNEKGYYFMAFTLSLFAVITIQKNIRDLQVVKEYENPYEQGDVFLEKDDFLKEKE